MYAMALQSNLEYPDFATKCTQMNEGDCYDQRHWVRSEVHLTSLWPPRFDYKPAHACDPGQPHARVQNG